MTNTFHPQAEGCGHALISELLLATLNHAPAVPLLP